jgi:hypothetical protein
MHQAQLEVQPIQQAARGLLGEKVLLALLLNSDSAGRLSSMSALWMLSLSWVDLIVSSLLAICLWSLFDCIETPSL